MDVREKLVELLSQYFDIGDSYCYNLTRTKNAFACGTMGFDDFEEFDDETISDIADHLIAHGVTVQEWISVKDRLPEEDGKYIVFEQSGGRTNTSILRFAKDARKVDKNDFKVRWKNVWYEYDSEWGNYTVNSVTHWQYLPQPPKGE